MSTTPERRDEDAWLLLRRIKLAYLIKVRLNWLFQQHDMRGIPLTEGTVRQHFDAVERYLDEPVPEETEVEWFLPSGVEDVGSATERHEPELRAIVNDGLERVGALQERLDAGALESSDAPGELHDRLSPLLEGDEHDLEDIDAELPSYGATIRENEGVLALEPDMTDWPAQQ